MYCDTLFGDNSTVGDHQEDSAECLPTGVVCVCGVGAWVYGVCVWCGCACVVWCVCGVCVCGMGGVCVGVGGCIGVTVCVGMYVCMQMTVRVYKLMSCL